MTDPQQNPVRPRSRSRRTLAATTVFAVATLGALLGFAGPASAAGPTVTVSPSSGLTNGQNVTVKGSGFTANYPQMVVVQCAATATGANGCNVNDVKFPKADANGAFTVTLTVRSKFGSTDCTKVECIVQAHEGINPSSGKTGTSSALHFGAAAKPSPAPTHKKTTAAPAPVVTSSSAAAAAPGTHSPSAGVGAEHAAAPPAAGGALPTAADTGKAVSTSVPLISEAGGAAALALLVAGLLLYRRRASVHGD
jgi:hypothetical protein